MTTRVFLLILAALTPLTPAQEPQKNPQDHESNLLTEIRQITFEGLRAGEGYFNADGTSMIFQSERSEKNPFYQIYRMDLETGDTERISPGIGKTTCAWIHPDNKRVLYASTHEDPQALVKMKAELDFRASGEERRYAWDYDETYDLFVFNPETKEQTNLTKTLGYDAEGSFSPDGQWIAFASNRAAYTDKLSEKDQQRFEADKSLFMDIYIMRADGSDLKRLTRARGYDGGPFFSPDGSKICWRRFSENGLTAEVFTMNVDGSDKKQLTTINAMSWAPSFHPSGEYLIFSTNKHGFGNFELYLVDKNGEGEPRRVTWTDKFDGLPMFLPEGDRLAWTSQRTSNAKSQIFMGKWNHERALTMIRSGRASASRPASRPATASRPTEMTAYQRIAYVMNKIGVATEAGISKNDLKLHLETLASPATRGRFTGSMGEELAAIYAARRFREIGLAPVDGMDADSNVELTAPGATMELVLRSLGFIQKFDFKVKPSPHSPEMTGTGNNVFGILKTDAADKLPAIVVGAHIDHLGTTGGGSRGPKEDRNKIHHGADDNASGVAALIEIAEYLADMKSRGKLKTRRDIVFCCWSGEELGLVGSTYFMNQLWEKSGSPAHLRDKIAAYINMDMVGRLRDKLTIQGVGSSPVWAREIERRNAPVGLNISVNEDVRLPTDTSPFYAKGIPIANVFSGAHTDYHRHTDTADKINYDGLHKITRFVALVVRGLAISNENPQYIEVKEEEAPTGRRSQSVSLGTIPDYAEADIPGLALDGVVPGGPGDKAGLKGGDIVVELGGQEVTDIQTYMGAFGKLTVGKEAKIVVVRDGKEIELTIVPGARK